MSDTAEANRWETTAYAKGVAVHSPIPMVDDYGTYVAGYVPIKRNGKVRGLIAAEFDSAPLGDLQSIVRKTFLLFDNTSVAIVAYCCNDSGRKVC